jgi:CBS domain containing-hemolysin-like protein
MIVNLVLAVLLIAGNFFFVAAEFAITRARPTEVAELGSRGARGAASLRHAVDHIDAYLSACQLGITLCSIGLGLAGEPAFAHLLGPVLEPLGRWAGVGSAAVSFAVAYALLSTLHVVVGELAPKSLAIARTRPTGLALAPPLRAFYVVTKPAVDLLNWLGNLVLRPFGIPPAREAGHAPHTEAELRRLVRESRHEGLIDPEEHEFTDNVLTFGDRRAREAMVPRPRVELLTTDQTLEEAIARATEGSHTRYPLCEPDGGLDAAVGQVHVKDLLRSSREDGGGDLRELARPLRRVPDATMLDDLLEELRREHQHLALVVDEHGTAVGVITLEDVLEEIVGEIQDEFDADGDDQPVRKDGSLLVAGSAPLRLVADRLDLDAPGSGKATVGGFVVEQLGHLPKAGDWVEVGGRRAEVTAVDEDEAQVTQLRFPADRPPGGNSAGP